MIRGDNAKTLGWGIAAIFLVVFLFLAIDTMEEAKANRIYNELKGGDERS